MDNTKKLLVTLGMIHAMLGGNFMDEAYEFMGDELKAPEGMTKMSLINRESYCKDCDRSIYGKYHDCDVNIENDGKYVMSDEKCYCKIVNGKRAEEYPWERRK